MKYVLFSILCLILLAVVGCNDDEHGCPTIERVNFCVTQNGTKNLSNSLIFVRERETNPIIFDTLKTQYGNCFSGVPGNQRVLVYSSDSLAYTSEWTQVDATGDCNDPEGKTVDVPL